MCLCVHCAQSLCTVHTSSMTRVALSPRGLVCLCWHGSDRSRVCVVSHGILSGSIHVCTMVGPGSQKNKVRRAFAGLPRGHPPCTCSSRMSHSRALPAFLVRHINPGVGQVVLLDRSIGMREVRAEGNGGWNVYFGRPMAHHERVKLQRAWGVIIYTIQYSPSFE